MDSLSIVMAIKDFYFLSIRRIERLKPGHIVGKSKGDPVLYRQSVPVPAKSGLGMLGVFATLAGLAGCAAPPPPAAIYDPNEAANRDIHTFNLALDKSLVRPVAGAYDAILPPPVQQGVANFANNLDVPGDIVNNLLQGKPHFALQNTMRFALNSTVGIGGLFDFSSAIGLPGVETDFGETLHVWGTGEGAYVELPALGPSTERDTVGTVVDIAMNPVGFVLKPPESYVGTAAKLGSKLGDRSRFSNTVDSIYYDSADSYAQLRLLYLEKRRHDLGQTDAESDATFLDPYEDPYGQ
jgi:phospholipid-binding lipoprotein MlaA